MKGLDRYLTTEPQDDFTPFCEGTYESLSDEAYEIMERLKFIGNPAEAAFLSHLFKTQGDDTKSYHQFASLLISYFKEWLYYTNAKAYYTHKISLLK